MNAHVSIAGIVAELSGVSDELAGKYRDWIVRAGEPAIRLEVGGGHEGWEPHERPDMRLWIAPDRRRASVLPRGGDGSVDRALRLMMAEALGRQGGVLLHAAAAAAGDEIVAFAGESGAGKSTVARLAGASRMVADDTLALRKEGVWMAHATPFHNWGQALPKPRRAPLAAIFLLEKALIDDVATVSQPVPALMRHALTGPPGYCAAEFLDAVVALAEVPVARLRRTRDGDVERLLLPGTARIVRGAA